MEKKRIIIRNGTPAIYRDKTCERPVIICNVEKDTNLGILFSAIDRKTNTLIRHNGIVVKWYSKSIDTGVIRIENPEYEEDSIPENGVVEIDELKEKRDSLRKFFKDNIKFNNAPFTLDDEQLTAVLTEQNSLITARAGSGKTRVLIAKLIYLFAQQKLDETNVLAFCFNKDASIEISDRLNNKCLVNGELRYQDYNIAKTFHAFSLSVLNISGKILDNIARTKLIKLIINDLRANDSSFSGSVYQFFRKDTLRIDRKNFNTTEAYYKYRRNCNYTTLNGEKVKSKIEKYIADYLFEHGIKYIYEKSFYPYKISFENAMLTEEEVKRYLNITCDKKETKPDFYLPEFNLIWEHWALTGNEDKEGRSDFEKLVGGYNDYLQNKEWKQKFWSGDWRSKLADIGKYNNSFKDIKYLIETTQEQLDLKTREEIEKEIEKFLAVNGIYAKKLPEEVLIEKVWKKCIDGFTILVDQFIYKLEQNYFDDIDAFLRDAKSIEDEKTRIYYNLSYKVYKKYIDILSRDNNYGRYAPYNEYDFDFNQIIYECSKKILNGELDEKISQIKWILIDEYQDFSRLFDYLINAIIKRNNAIKIFCVGDDWQAINRFAGSDIKYFKSFLNRYVNAKLLNIRTNYRSENHIVEFANIFMNKCGISGSRPKSVIIGSGISIEIDISSIYIGKYDEENVYLNLFEEYEHNRVEKAQYIKACEDIIKNNVNKKIMILNRSNTILGKDLEEFNTALKKVCLRFMTLENYNNNIFVKTVHRSKGEEADTVILLDVNKGVFPVFNPNNDLFEVFGHSSIEAVEDEEKLYYVAITRAKHNLFVLYDDKTKSSFIMS